jgi:hypothetical protein
MQLRFLQLLLAASAAGKALKYKPPTIEFESEIVEFLDWIRDNGFTTKDVHDAYVDTIKECNHNSKLSEIDIFRLMSDFY